MLGFIYFWLDLLHYVQVENNDIVLEMKAEFSRPVLIEKMPEDTRCKYCLVYPALHDDVPCKILPSIHQDPYSCADVNNDHPSDQVQGIVIIADLTMFDSEKWSLIDDHNRFVSDSLARTTF